MPRRLMLSKPILPTSAKLRYLKDSSINLKSDQDKVYQEKTELNEPI